MINRTITLRADLVERLEDLAQRQGKLITEVFGDLLNTYAPQGGGNSALAVAEGIEAADIDWIDDSNASLEN